MDESTITFSSRDGLEIQTWRWAPDGDPRAVLQVQLGLGEHAGHYRRFGEALTQAGYLVYAPDGRGSGRTANGAYGSWGPDSWPGWVDDLVRLNAYVKEHHPDLEHALFGHSMGSFATQQFLLDHSADVDAVVLSGTTDPAGIAAMFSGDEPADLSALNAGFEDRTGFEWLSRDETEVDKYVADEACGFEFEPFRGLDSLAAASDPARVAGVRTASRSCSCPVRRTRSPEAGQRCGWSPRGTATPVSPTSRTRSTPTPGTRCSTRPTGTT